MLLTDLCHGHAFPIARFARRQLGPFLLPSPSPGVKTGAELTAPSWASETARPLPLGLLGQYSVGRWSLDCILALPCPLRWAPTVLQTANGSDTRQPGPSVVLAVGIQAGAAGIRAGAGAGNATGAVTGEEDAREIPDDRVVR